MGCFFSAGAFTSEVSSISESIDRINEPSLTSSPTLMSIDLINPDAGEGISIEALSDSTVINESSILILSPTLTIISITSTLSKSPIFGMCIFFNSAI